MDKEKETIKCPKCQNKSWLIDSSRLPVLEQIKPFLIDGNMNDSILTKHYWKCGKCEYQYPEPIEAGKTIVFNFKWDK